MLLRNAATSGRRTLTPLGTGGIAVSCRVRLARNRRALWNSARSSRVRFLASHLPRAFHCCSPQAKSTSRMKRSPTSCS